MAKSKISEYSTTALSNSDVGGIGILGTNLPENFDNALREIMKQIADLNTGASFIHDTYKIADSDAETKLAKFDAGSITAGQTRTFTFPDKDGTFAIAADVLALSGGTLTGFVTLHAAPTSDLHAASKKYVDDNAANTDAPVFTGDAQFENISDGTTAVDAGYVVNGSPKAFVNYDGTGTVAIRKSLNVSSITDAGSGNQLINFTTDISHATDYAVQVTKQNVSVNTATIGNDNIAQRTASQIRISLIENNVLADSENVNATVFGDLA
jgi:hypothetical protein